MASEDMDVRASSANAERACLQNFLQNSEVRDESLERELLNCRTSVNYLAAAKSAPNDRIFAADTRRKDINDVRTV